MYVRRYAACIRRYVVYNGLVNVRTYLISCFYVRLKSQIREQEEVCDQLSASMCDSSSGLQSSECYHPLQVLYSSACMHLIL